MVSLTLVKDLLGALPWSWRHRDGEKLVPKRKVQKQICTICWIHSNTWGSIQGRSWLSGEQGRSGKAIRRDLEKGQRLIICVARFYCPQRKLFLDDGMFLCIWRKTKRDRDPVSVFLPFMQGLTLPSVSWLSECKGERLLSYLMGALQQFSVGFERKTHLPVARGGFHCWYQSPVFTGFLINVHHFSRNLHLLSAYLCRCCAHPSPLII